MIIILKKLKWQLLLVLTACSLSVLVAPAQINPAQLRQFITENKQPAGVNEFYAHYNYQAAWMQKPDSENRNILLDLLRRSTGMGLDEKDYHTDYLASCNNRTLPLRNTVDSLQAEVMITGLALGFFHDVAYGNTKPDLGYDGLKYTPGCQDIPSLLAACLARGELRSLIRDLSPPLPEIAAIGDRISWFNRIMSDSSFHEQLISSNKTSWPNTALITKLYQLGIIGSATVKLADSALKQSVKESQRLFGLLEDGELRSTILNELNVPLAARLKQLDLSVNYYRWLYCQVQGQPVIVVNLPAAYLKVYQDNNIILQMKVIAGKRSTPTPTLVSTVNEVVLYPYWHVPYSIATKELLPAIKRNAGFIDAGNYQVLDRKGRIIDPYRVNWHAFSARYFPFTIRQSTGCDNSLGLLKLNFYSPFGVYLHDTPGKNLFMLNKRYFSHGCMRMEKPMELGHLVLRNNAIAIDTLEQKGCLRNQAPVIVKADVQMPVIVWYNPAGVDSNGRLLFYEDVYGKFAWMRKPE